MNDQSPDQPLPQSPDNAKKTDAQQAFNKYVEATGPMWTFWTKLITTETPPTWSLWLGAVGGWGCLFPVAIVLCLTVIGAVIGIPLAAIAGGGGTFCLVVLLYRYLARQGQGKTPPPTPSPGSH